MNTPGFYDGKTVLLTGASTGIGKALAIKLMHTKCKLVLVARRRELISEFVTTQPKRENLIISGCDVSDKEAVSLLLDEVTQKMGQPDIVILNAGVSLGEKYEILDEKATRATMEINFFGVVNFVHPLLQSFRERKSGTFVIVSSLADGRGYPQSAAYSASKAAVSIFAESLAVKTAPLGLKVITVKPGFVKTPMTDKNQFPMPFMISAEIAAEIIFNGIINGKRMIKFPFMTSFLTSLANIAPFKIFAKAVRR
jgi:short-subunit dehydrogenase